jgi:Uma2 family endonuclease
MKGANVMTAVPVKRWTPEEYLEFERRSAEKHDLFDGEIYMMSGASRRHNLIAGNLYAALHTQLRARQCEAYINDMRVRIERRNYVYPDVVVVCDPPHLEDDQLDTLLNPTLIGEVLSPTTEQYDRGRKSQAYRAVDSLREYVLVAQDRPYVERYVRQDAGWLLTEVTGLDATLTLDAIGCTLPLRDLYERVNFEE